MGIIHILGALGLRAADDDTSTSVHLERLAQREGKHQCWSHGNSWEFPKMRKGLVKTPNSSLRHPQEGTPIYRNSQLMT